MSRDSTGRILRVAFLLCLICSVLVSVAAIGLSERQQRNKLEEKHRNILLAAGLYQEGKPVAEQYQQIEARLVDLQQADFSDRFDPASFDSRVAVKDPQLSVAIPADRDLAGIRRRARYKEVYLVRQQGQLQQLILPVHGKGLWSTLYGFLSLASDLNSINGFAFYEHGETPGLGGEIDNPSWKQQWHGKKIYDDSGRLRLRVLKGRVDKAAPDAIYQADGLAGATLTGRGVDHLLHYWLGEDGYRPFLRRLQQGEITP